MRTKIFDVSDNSNQSYDGLLDNLMFVFNNPEYRKMKENNKELFRLSQIRAGINVDKSMSLYGLIDDKEDKELGLQYINPMDDFHDFLSRITIFAHYIYTGITSHSDLGSLTFNYIKEISQINVSEILSIIESEDDDEDNYEEEEEEEEDDDDE